VSGETQGVERVRDAGERRNTYVSGVSDGYGYLQLGSGCTGCGLTAEIW
jgi:hypothetical protein